LIELTRQYSRGLGSFETGPVEARDEGSAGIPRRQCEDCLTVYDPAYGDPVSGVPAGVSFEGLPRDYQCPVCSADKERFAPMSV
jgi:rubredoxin